MRIDRLRSYLEPCTPWCKKNHGIAIYPDGSFIRVFHDEPANWKDLVYVTKADLEDYLATVGPRKRVSLLELRMFVEMMEMEDV